VPAAGLAVGVAAVLLITYAAVRIPLFVNPDLEAIALIVCEAETEMAEA
jgi:hypothetical protein